MVFWREVFFFVIIGDFKYFYFDYGWDLSQVYNGRIQVLVVSRGGFRGQVVVVVFYVCCYFWCQRLSSQWGLQFEENSGFFFSLEGRQGKGVWGFKEEVEVVFFVLREEVFLLVRVSCLEGRDFCMSILVFFFIYEEVGGGFLVVVCLVCWLLVGVQVSDWEGWLGCCLFQGGCLGIYFWDLVIFYVGSFFFIF